MNDSTCPRPCLMKLDLQSSTNKLAFLKDNWPSFGQIEAHPQFLGGNYL